MEFLTFLLFLFVGFFIAISIWAVVSNQNKKTKRLAEQRRAKMEVEEIKSTVLISAEANEYDYRFDNNIIRICIDEFDQSKKLYFFISEGNTFYGDVFFSVDFKSIGDEDRINFGCYQKELKIKKGDVVSFLFDDGSVIDFTLQKNGYKIDKDMEGVLIESYGFIDSPDLEKFAAAKLKKFRFKTSSLENPLTFDLDEGKKKAFQNTAKIYQYTLNNIYRPEKYLETDNIEPLSIHGAEFVKMKMTNEKL